MWNSAAVSHLSGSFDQNKITRGPRGHSVPQNGLIVDQIGFYVEMNRYLQKKKKKKKSSCHNHKSTKRNKQHFQFLYYKTFLRLLSLCHHKRNGYTRFTRLVGSHRENGKKAPPPPSLFPPSNVQVHPFPLPPGSPLLPVLVKKAQKGFCLDRVFV